MSVQRIFPRYRLEDNQAQAQVEGSNYQFKVINISLGGIKIESEESFSPSFIKKINLKVIDQTFELKTSMRWKDQKKDDQKTIFRSGFKLYFDSEKEFGRWLTLIKAIHNIQLKNFKREE